MPSRSNDFWNAFHGGPDAVTRWNAGREFTKYGRVSQAARGSVLSAFLRGGASALLPIEPMPHLMKSEAQIAGRERMIKLAEENPNLRYNPKTGKGVKLSLWERATTKGTRAIGRSAFRTGTRWLGPVITTYRLGTEVDPTRQGVGGAVSKTGRIIGEEVISTAAFVGGMALGGKIGAVVGATVGSVIPGAGTVVGGAVGFVAGMAIGAIGSGVGSFAWNKAMDVAEMPFRAAAAGWKYFESAGRRAVRMELGGQVSRANSSRVAYTMRSRALQQMSRSGINARSLLGQEASMMHIR